MAPTFQLISTPLRELAPWSHRAGRGGNEEAFSMVEQDYAAWISSLSKGEALFKKHVYDNPEAEDYDFRQHRAKLYLLLAQGEALAVELLSLSSANEASVVNYVALIDQKLDGLRAVLRAWHGSLEEQADVPASFKQGIEDLGQGRLVDMERALSEAPAPLA
jgi:hypothetical protein